MQFKEIHYGKINTHLDALLADIESALLDKYDLEEALNKLNKDPIYKLIASEMFCLPVSTNPLSERLKQRIQTIKDKTDKHRDDLKPFLETIDRFIISYHQDWNEHSYFIVPVITEIDNTKTPGMVYLHTIPRMPTKYIANRILNIGDLTRDDRLLSSTEDYFGKIASTLMKTYYFVQTYPFDSYDGLTGHSYKLYFDCQITEGKSIGAAMLAMFAIVYLNSVLRTQYKETIAPQCGTVLTGEIDTEGNVLPVEDLEAKISCVVDEFGSAIKVILPRDQPLPEKLLRRINHGNIYYVSTTEELLATVLSSGDDPRGLDKARSISFQSLSPSVKDCLRKFIREGIDPNIYEWMASGHSTRMTPKHNECGVYVISRAWHDRIDINLSLEPSGLQDDEKEHQYRELVEVIIDGSEPMNEHWVADANTRICHMTEILYEIARSIDPERQELVCGFFSHSNFYPIKHGALASHLEQMLQESREKHKLQYRGTFFRPVYETSIKDYQKKLKRVYLISDSVIPDLKDLSDLNVSSLTRLRLYADENEKSNSEDHEFFLFSGDEKLNKTAISLCFQRVTGTIHEIQIDLGEELPIEWKPREGILSLYEGNFILRWKMNELKAKVLIRMANQYPHVIKISGQISSDNVPKSFSFMNHPTSGTLESLSLYEYGKLNDNEFRMWQDICFPERECIECHECHVHLVHRSEYELQAKPVFPSLSHLKHGFLLMCAGLPDWYFFQTGCQINGISFVLLDGKPHWSQAKGRIEEVPWESDLYCLRVDLNEFYLCRL